jgi:hypothetical protein
MLRWFIIIFGSLYVITMWGVLFYIIKKGLGPYFKSKRQPKINIAAVIKHKIGHEDFHSLTWQTETVRKIIIFQCEDGVDREYDVPDEVWDWTEDGAEGTLTYQGHLFVDFQARRPMLNIDKAHERLIRW